LDFVAVVVSRRDLNPGRQRGSLIS